MKKVLTVLLVLSLVATGLFAGSFKVGAELGWGFDFYKAKYTASEKAKIYDTEVTVDGNINGLFKNNGFAMNLVGEYDFTENWGIKASAGMMFAGKSKMKLDGKVSVKQGGISYPFMSFDNVEETAEEKSGMYFDFIVDGKYSIKVSDKFSISGLAGVEMLLGNVFYEKEVTDDAKKNLKNFAFGANIGVEVSYMVINNLDINLGVTGAWFFVNTCDILKATGLTPEGVTLKKSANSFYIRPYIGATYAF